MNRCSTALKTALVQFPKIIDSIFDSIDAISNEAAKILQKPLMLDGNGSEVLENGGRSATLTPSPAGINSLGDHQNLQVIETTERTATKIHYYC